MFSGSGRFQRDMGRSRSVALWGVALLALVGCDHVTKHVAKVDLQGHPPKPLVGSVLELRYTENTDVAFNLLRTVPEQTRAPLLLASGLFGCAALLVLLALRPQRTAIQAALVLVAAGALGNTLDRVARGYVVDFIHVPHWPVFNVADICVTAGAVLLMAASLRRSAPAAGSS
jgi:signal peptidase II